MSLSCSKTAASVTPASAPQDGPNPYPTPPAPPAPHLQRGEEQCPEVGELAQALYIVPVVAHQEVEGPAKSNGWGQPVVVGRERMGHDIPTRQ